MGIKKFFAVSNEINENTVMGVVFSICLIVSTFLGDVSADKYYILAGLVAIFFGLNLTKKE